MNGKVFVDTNKKAHNILIRFCFFCRGHTDAHRQILKTEYGIYAENMP